MANTFYPVISGQPILNGPAKFDLMCALFQKGATVEFTVKGNNGNIVVRLLVLGIDAEDGSRESWVIKGSPINSNGGSSTESMKLYYDSRTRRGTVTEYKVH